MIFEIHINKLISVYLYFRVYNLSNSTNYKIIFLFLYRKHPYLKTEQYLISMKPKYEEL